MMEEFDPLKIEEIVLNLKLISKIKQNDKMVVVNKILKVDTRPLQSVWRWYTSDNRSETIFFIDYVINSALECINQTKDVVFDDETLKKEMTITLAGLDNLCATYKIDTLIVSRIDILKEKINRLCGS